MRASGLRSCTGVLLAGGGSTRFGGNAKGLLEVGGRRLIDRALDALRPATSAQIVVAKDVLLLERVLPGLRVVGDSSPDRASLVGIHTALAATGGAVLVVAWDMPFVPGALLRALRAAGERDHAAAVPEGPRGVEPLCAYYPAAALDVVSRQLECGDLRLGALVDALPAVTVLPACEVERYGPLHRIFTNVNTPADLADAERWLANEGARMGGEYVPASSHLPEHR